MRTSLTRRRIAAAMAGGALTLGLAACSSDDDADEISTEDAPAAEAGADDTETTDDDGEDTGIEEDDDASDGEEDDTDAPVADGDHVVAGWAEPVTTPGEQVGTIEGENFQVEIYQVDVTTSPKDGMLVDPDDNEPILAEGDDLVFVNYVVTNTSDEPIDLGSSLVSVDATYADWEYLQGMDSITDHDLWEDMGVNTSAVAERSDDGVYTLGAGESYSLGDNFLYKTDSPVVFEATLTPVDADGELLHDDRQEESVEIDLS